MFVFCVHIYDYLWHSCISRFEAAKRMSMERDRFSRYIVDFFTLLLEWNFCEVWVSCQFEAYPYNTLVRSDESPRQIVVNLGSTLSHQHCKVKFTTDPLLKKPDPGVIAWYKSYSLYIPFRVRKRALEKDVHIHSSSFFLKKSCRNDFFVVGEKLYASRKHLKIKSATDFCWANLALNLSLRWNLAHSFRR